MSRGLILWSTDEPDLIRHTAAVEMPTVAAPDDPPIDPTGVPRRRGRIVDGINTWSDDIAAAAVQNVWTRYRENFTPVANQAIVSWATDGYLIGTAMLPHAGYNEGHAHKTISTGVVSHTVNFHDRFRADEWLLLANESIWAGRGRTHGRCNIWTQSGASSRPTPRTTCAGGPREGSHGGLPAHHERLIDDAYRTITSFFARRRARHETDFTEGMPCPPRRSKRPSPTAARRRGSRSPSARRSRREAKPAPRSRPSRSLAAGYDVSPPTMRGPAS
jgi:hypothetical protein